MAVSFSKRRPEHIIIYSCAFPLRYLLTHEKLLNTLCYFFITDIHDFILERNNATNNTDYLSNDFLKATLQFSGKLHLCMKLVDKIRDLDLL